MSPIPLYRFLQLRGNVWSNHVGRLRRGCFLTTDLAPGVLRPRLYHAHEPTALAQQDAVLATPESDAAEEPNLNGKALEEGDYQNRDGTTDTRNSQGAWSAGRPKIFSRLRSYSVTAWALAQSGASFPVAGIKPHRELDVSGSNKLSKLQTQMQTILARHILTVHPNRGDEAKFIQSIQSTYDQSTIAYLESRGVGVEDIEVWTWILCSKTADMAAMKLQLLLSSNIISRSNQPPLSILLHILRAKSLTANSIMTLVAYATHHYRQQFEEIDRIPSTSPDYRIARHQHRIDEPSTMILIARLLRHARRRLPEAFGGIAELACFALRGSITTDTNQLSTLEPDSLKSLIKYFNGILELLAVPSIERPFAAIPMQEQAQFRVLRRMTEFSPHIPITRKAFQAIVRTQVARRKTGGEEEWADFKAVTWPPWKKDRSGLDVGKEFEGSMSRAQRVLTQMMDAGYSHGEWENMAKILAGWDLDGSPTIQTRQIIPPPKKSIDLVGDIAAARILATRTLREAWACFLEYEKLRDTSYNATPSTAPYEAMFQKLLARTVDQGSEAIPGDVREVFPEPTSMHDFLYLSEDPPTTTESLLQRMINSGLQPSSRIIQMLTEKESNFFVVVNILTSHPPLREHLSVLFRLENFDSAASFSAEIQHIDPAIVAAYVEFLTRLQVSPEAFRRMRHTADIGQLPNLRRSRRGPSSLAEDCGYTASEFKTLLPLQYAHCILKLGQIRYRPAWKHVLKSAIRRCRTHNSLHGYDAWVKVRQILDDMKSLDIAMDLHLCEEMCSALSTILPFASRGDVSLGDDQVREVETEATDLAKTSFANLVAGHVDFGRLARTKTILTVPRPYLLLSLVRVLGLTRDFDSILALLKWMSRFAVPLSSAAAEQLGGERQLRSVLVTARLFLEQLWLQERFWQEAPLSVTEPASSTVATAQQAQKIVDLIPGWDGWPSDEEVRRLCVHSTGSQRWNSRLWARELLATSPDEANPPF